MLDTTGAQREGHVQELLDRCARLGVLAVAYRTGAGEVTRCEPSSIMARTMRDMLGACVEAGGGLRELTRGVWTATLTLVDESGPHARVAMVFAEGVSLEAGGAMHAWLEGKVEGVLSWERGSAEATLRALSTWTEDLGNLSRQLVDRETFTSQLSGAFEQIDLMYQLGRSMKQPSIPSQFLSGMCHRARATLSFGWMAACFSNEDACPKSLRGSVYVDGGLPADRTRVRDEALALLADLRLKPGQRMDLGVIACGQIALQPLELKGRRVGLLVAGGKHGSDPQVSSYDTQLLEATGGFLSAFIENVGLYDDQDDLFLGTVQAMTAAIDAKDAYTRGHSERVALVAFMIAKAAGLSERDCQDVRIAGLVHDVGKIGVPESVLTKPGRLTDDEFAHIKRHPEVGYRILKGVRLLERVLPGVLSHHERWDGKGYPHGLAGYRIPLIARVMAVADTFDAMSSDRSYRKKLSREHVLTEILRCGGSQLDPLLAPLIQKIDLGAYDAMAERHASQESSQVSSGGASGQTAQAA